MSSKLHVAVGVIKNSNGDFLISKRHKHLDQGGLWEFPGGKVEKNESAYTAICRELYEELNINVVHAEPLIKISYQYPNKQVLLDVWLVSNFNGVAVSQQAQALKWVALSAIEQYRFPDANRAILTCLNLPSYYAITGRYRDKNDYLLHLKQILNSGIKLIQLRDKHSTTEQLVELAKSSVPLCAEYKAKLIVNENIDFLDKCNVDGIHLNSQRLLSLTSRPISHNKLLVASVHNHSELLHAIKINADFVVVSPVLETSSHPGAITLDWAGLDNIVSQSSIPVFSLGGMKKVLLNKVKQTGAFGIAAISEFWQ